MAERKMAAFAEVLSRDRWRIYKCKERLRAINLGGTAMGIGLAAPWRGLKETVIAGGS
ncbi:MAG: hypothetical protein JW797_04305 [Bradymonadales bacterium]|nr:hypothetical protein [Bradymonadales bacterium]